MSDKGGASEGDGKDEAERIEEEKLHKLTLKTYEEKLSMIAQERRSIVLISREPMPVNTKADPLLSKTEWGHLWDNTFKKGEMVASKPLQPEREMRTCERNSSTDTKVSDEGGGGVAPGAGAEIPVEPIVKTMVRQAVPLKPAEHPRWRKWMPEGGCDLMV
ncbi:suppression of tumorigenicity 5 protein isoform x4 [Willisornis vidua]|uniref:Suppression of tumorigenicity 5 protein isoform x4 n=1 Tax=Willisornis vidua TaxID=1566151 RepID=A0ABQ9DEY7_9PASS|nr:suppression of tumorigenicity 5 protein isoform x4 [Willisornis vidua]